MYHQPEKRQAVVATTVLGWFMVALLQRHVAHAFVYTVGDERGWTFDVVNWSNGKSFTAGDQLQFYYTKGEHNVVVVNKEIFEKCFDSSDKTKYPTYDSGYDTLVLKQGYNYFSSSLPRDCAGGVKLAVFAQ